MITWRANKDAPDTAWAGSPAKHLLVVHGRSYSVIELQDTTFQPWRMVANGTAASEKTARTECERAFARVGMTQEERNTERERRINERREALEKAGGVQPAPTGRRPRERRVS